MDSSLLQLEQKSALIVGGGQGIGESAARSLAKAGCGVAVADVVKERATRVANAVADLGQRSVPIEANVLDDQSAKTMVVDADRLMKGLDIMVTIVGQASLNPLMDLTLDQWDHDHRLNLRYVFLVAREFSRLRIATRRPGAIVCIASVGGLQSAPHHAAYGAAKAGLINLVRTMAVEWAPHNIRVNAIAPGAIITPRIPETPAREDYLRQSHVPAKRRGTSDEVGKAVLFLASDLASYVTGQTLAVDGGWMAAYLLGLPAVLTKGMRDIPTDS